MGFSEMALLFLLGVLLFGPKKTSELARQVGQHVADPKRTASDLQAQVAIDMPPEALGGKTVDNFRQTIVGVLAPVLTSLTMHAPAAAQTEPSAPVALAVVTPPL